MAENEDVKKVYHLVQESVAREKEHANAKESMSQSDLQTTGQFPPRPKGIVAYFQVLMVKVIYP